VVLGEFDLDVITGPDVELAQQILTQAEITLTAVDHEPRAVLDAVDVCENWRSLGGERRGNVLGDHDRVAAALG
jgi:hypothetical protein